ncbi:hypothetical protein [Pontibacter sp. SGAir0037]|uniref:hypothetical protein n=1 Tax=Pontibacter sp. SGAir0037 TaxID=2571030 RepID=UPI0010CD633A|nr:hypothetical protein [Pontibacter sp. SGAir0037]QCR22674.1 hypothetical protein C1N53_10185 [Pontibacter sp. SGAir0037]
MKKVYLLFFFSFICFSAVSQKNIFTIPDPEPVERGKLYLQPGFQITGDNIQLSNILTYGLGKRFQAGINLNDLTINYTSRHNVLPYDSVAPAENPDVLLNFQKSVEISKTFELGIGTWSGTNIASKVNLSSFNYLNLSAALPSESKLILGGYYGNSTFLGEGNNIGLMAGFDVPLVEDKFKLIGDYTSGTNERSVFNLGVEFQLPGNWQLSVGAILPSPGSDNAHGITIQINN